MREIPENAVHRPLGFLRDERRAGQRLTASGTAPARMGMAVAYLSNVYPKISHSFIKTEIAALERQGFDVHRLTIRRADDTIPEDRAEAQRTTVVLENSAALAMAVTMCLWSRPVAALKALALAWRTGGSGNRIRACAYFAEAALIARSLERAGIGHVHAHFGTNPAMVARLVARLGRVTYSFTAHGPDEFDAPRTLDLPGKIAEAAFVVGVSNFGRGQLLRWSHPDHWERIHVVHCAPDPMFLAGRAQEVAGRGETVRFLCVARLSAQKGLPLLLEAVARVGQTRPILLDVIGGGEDRAIIEGQIERLGIGDVVTLHGWASPRTIRTALGASRALVLPSLAEGLPVVLMEAMALRVPVIATAVAGIPELVDGQVGWLVPSGSAEDLADALCDALDTRAADLAAMGERGWKRVTERHDPLRSAAQLAALMRPLAKRR
ncbi:glycosyltransferase [Novosphingobium sp. AP12]|uniref:glycosyltransferase n=1 Tax=Novosphingobium sp. AP12 TaxID=1144305 RepID=UPI000271E2CC|nr:glycosyltransferase [Novosphingobium sp. AP12]EJL23332.1 glycosyltransferase [Novosphingobium sp. AP12]